MGNSKRGSSNTVHYNLEVDSILWKKFKDNLRKSDIINDFFVEKIKKFVEETEKKDGIKM